MKELTEKRKLREKPFLKPNGEMIAYVYDEDVHYLQDGKYLEINNTLIKNKDSFENKQNSFKSIFNKKNLLEMRKGDNYLVINLKNSMELLPFKKNKEEITYRNILNDIDIDYQVKNTKVKEAIILHSQENIPKSLEFEVSTNLDLNMKDNKIIASKNNVEIFMIEEPFMFDSIGSYNYNISYQLDKLSNNYLITLKLDTKWLHDKRRVFPISIDPTITNSASQNNVYDTYICNTSPKTNYGGENILKVGVDRDGNIYRSLLKFDLPTIGTGSQVINAYISLFPNLQIADLLYREYSYIDVHEMKEDWQERSATWETTNDKYNPRLEYYSDYHLNYHDPVIHDVPFDVTNLVKKWYSGTPNYGVMLKSHIETKEKNYDVCKYVSKNNNISSDPKPILVITYRNQNGLEDYLAYKTQNYTYGTSHINTYNGNLTTAFDIISTLGGKSPANVLLYYNTNDVILENNYGYGLGYKLNYHQTLKPVIIESINYIEYVDADGTIHYFVEEKYGHYKDEDNLNLTVTPYGPDAKVMIDKSGNKSFFTQKGDTYYLTQIISTEGDKTLIDYDSDLKITKITDPVKNIINISYSSNKITFKTKEKEVTLNTNNESQVEVLNIDHKITKFFYNSLHLLNKITDTKEISLTFDYYNSIPYRMKKITELGLNNTLGKTLDITYDFNVTTFTDNLGHKNTYVFNNVGNAITVTNLDNTDSLSNAYGKSYNYFETAADKNRLQSSEQLNKTIKNYLSNSSFELDNEIFTITGGTKTFSEDYSLSGKRSLKVTGNNPLLEYTINIPQNAFYTFSIYAKGTGKLKLKIDNTTSETFNLTDNFERYQISQYINTPSLKISIELDSTTTYIDDIQLEQNEVANYYTMIENSDFSSSLSNWNLTAYQSDDGGIHLNPNYEIISIDNNLNALKINRDPYIAHNLDQTFNTSGKAGDKYVVSFWYKNSGLNNSYSAEFPANCKISFNTNEDIPTDDFPQIWLNYNEEEWQYYSETFVAEYDYDSLEFNLFLEDSANEFYITNITLYKDISRTDYFYDDEGNIIEINDTEDNSSTFNYNDNNELIKMMDPRGNNFIFEYDNNLTSRVLSGISKSGISNEIRYDNFGNPIITKTKVVGKNEKIPSGKYFIRSKGTDKYFEANFETKNIELKENNCSHDIWILTNTKDDLYTISPASLPSFYINQSRNGDIKLEKTPSLFTLNPQENGSYYITIFRRTRDDIASDLGANENGIIEIIDEGPIYPYMFEFYLESADYPYFIENTAEYTEDGKFIKSTTDTLLNKTIYDINETNGLINSETDPNGDTTYYTYNEKKQITSISKNDKTITYSYNDQDNLSKIISGAKEYNFEYDEFLKPKSVKIGNDITLITNEYESQNGNLKKSTYGNDHITTYTYDELDRPKSITKSNQKFIYRYDNFNNIAKIDCYNRDEELIKSHAYDYDKSSRLINYQSGDFDIKYNYDQNSNVTAKNYRKNSLQKTKSISYNLDNAVTTSVLDNSTINYSYDPLGRLTNSTLNDTFKTDYTYVSKGYRTSLLIDSLSSGSNKYSYKYDNLNNITHIYYNDTLTNEYFYDNLNELIKENDYKNSKTISYTYDTEGNILNKKIHPLNKEIVLDETTYSYDNSKWEDQLTNFNGTYITYDEIGNPKTIGNDITLNWQNGRELSSYKDTSKNLNVTYEYNKDGIRTSKIVNGVKHEYSLENSNIIFETIDSNVIYYLRDANSGLIGLDLNGTRYYYLKNAQEDITGIMDSNYNVIATYEYDSWGNILSIKDRSGNSITDETNIAIINPYRYRSYYYDEETKLYYLNSRYYNPKWGRFINADGIINADENINGYNLYTYTCNNPVNNYDEEGTFLGKIINKVKNIFNKSNTSKEKNWVKSENKNKLPTKSKPNSVKENPNGDKRFYGDDGKAKHDLDKSHPTHHPNLPNPHAHEWTWDGDNPSRGPAIDPKDLPESIVIVGTNITSSYILYRVMRLLPSLIPEFWWTIPSNLATP